jgi:hypothetical protein
METTMQLSESGGEREQELASEDVAFRWADHETLEELIVEVSGTPSFLRQLEELGFERLSSAGSGAAGAPPRATAAARRVLMDVRSAGHRRR